VLSRDADFALHLEPHSGFNFDFDPALTLALQMQVELVFLDPIDSSKVLDFQFCGSDSDCPGIGVCFLSLFCAPPAAPGTPCTRDAE
jgi:hypothetical protein